MLSLFFIFEDQESIKTIRLSIAVNKILWHDFTVLLSYINLSRTKKITPTKVVEKAITDI
ncbi:MAG: hypothetical protein EOP04_03700 [Proteobacteria bacterium]|nr:MAG: hypothetical protein EOP04_03700 [Pseudomonadota bacterium]